MKTYTITLANIARSYELTPADSHKSFWGKAHVFEMADGTKVLRSYSTYVAIIDKDGNLFRSWWGWSATTGRHIKSFMGLNKKGYESLEYVQVR